MKTRLSEQIEQWLAAESLTQAQAADRLEVSQSTIARWLAGAVPDPSGREKLGDALGMAAGDVGRLAATTDLGRLGAGHVVTMTEELLASLGMTGNAMVEFVGRANLSPRDRQILSLSFQGILDGIDGFGQLVHDLLEKLGEST